MATLTETRHQWGSRGWWCTALWACSGPEPHPELAAARWCPDSSTSLHSDNSWSALPRVRPAQPSRAGTAGWRSWRLCVWRLRRTPGALELSECGDDRGEIYVSFTWIGRFIWGTFFCSTGLQKGPNGNKSNKGWQTCAWQLWDQ